MSREYDYLLDSIEKEFYDCFEEMEQDIERGNINHALLDFECMVSAKNKFSEILKNPRYELNNLRNKERYEQIDFDLLRARNLIASKYICRGWERGRKR